jgi:hypothetical protein
MWTEKNIKTLLCEIKNKATEQLIYPNINLAADQTEK